MHTKSSKNEFGIFIKNDVPVVSSRDVAKRFGKEHKNVLQSIDNFDFDLEFIRLNFQPISYKDSVHRLQREYLLTKDGFAFLVMGFTVKEAIQWKIKYINAFNSMTDALKYKHNMKISFRPMTDAIQEAHENPQFYHYTNEIDMIYRIVLGKTSKKYRQESGLHEDTDIRDYISNEQKKMVDKLQVTNTGLINIGMDFQERKTQLTNLFHRDVNKIQRQIIDLLN